MEIIPAIDIYGGHCVRLYQGNYSMVERYHSDPVAVARQFEDAGAQRIHVVDLDAAYGQRRTNRKIIRKMRNAVSVTLQVGGGIRDDYVVEDLIDIGINYLVVSTVFVRTPHVLEGWMSHYGNIFIAGIDARDGKVYVNGWERETKIDAVDLAVKAAAFGIGAIIYTNIARDGTLQGPDIAGTVKLAQAANIPIILSGGISNEQDIKELIKQGNSKIAGVILGTSIYEKTIDLADAIAQYGSGGTA